MTSASTRAGGGSGNALSGLHVLHSHHTHAPACGMQLHPWSCVRNGPTPRGCRSWRVQRHQRRSSASNGARGFGGLEARSGTRARTVRRHCALLPPMCRAVGWHSESWPRWRAARQFAGNYHRNRAAHTLGLAEFDFRLVTLVCSVLQSGDRAKPVRMAGPKARSSHRKGSICRRLGCPEFVLHFLLAWLSAREGVTVIGIILGIPSLIPYEAPDRLSKLRLRLWRGYKSEQVCGSRAGATHFVAKRACTARQCLDGFNCTGSNLEIV